MVGTDLGPPRLVDFYHAEGLVGRALHPPHVVPPFLFDAHQLGGGEAALDRHEVGAGHRVEDVLVPLRLHGDVDVGPRTDRVSDCEVIRRLVGAKARGGPGHEGHLSAHQRAEGARVTRAEEPLGRGETIAAVAAPPGEGGKIARQGAGGQGLGALDGVVARKEQPVVGEDVPVRGPQHRRHGGRARDIAGHRGGEVEAVQIPPQEEVEVAPGELGGVEGPWVAHPPDQPDRLIEPKDIGGGARRVLPEEGRLPPHLCRLFAVQRA